MTNTTMYLDANEAEINRLLDAEYDRYEDEAPSVRRFRITIEGTIDSRDDRFGYGVSFEHAASDGNIHSLGMAIENAVEEGALWVSKVVAIDYLGLEAGDDDDKPIITSTYDDEIDAYLNERDGLSSTPVVAGR